MTTTRKDIVSTLARMTTPQDEFDAMDPKERHAAGYQDADMLRADMSDERLLGEHSALCSMIEAARTAEPDYLDMEAVMCMWEAIIENPEAFPEIEAWRAQNGVAETRHKIMALVPAMLEVRAMGDHDDWHTVGLYSYDFDWVPWFIRTFVVVRPDGFHRRDDWHLIASAKLKDARFNQWVDMARLYSKAFWCYADLIDDHPELFACAYVEGQSPFVAVQEIGKLYDLNTPDAMTARSVANRWQSTIEQWAKRYA